MVTVEEVSSFMLKLFVVLGIAQNGSFKPIPTGMVRYLRSLGMKVLFECLLRLRQLKSDCVEILVV